MGFFSSSNSYICININSPHWWLNSLKYPQVPCQVKHCPSFSCNHHRKVKGLIHIKDFTLKYALGKILSPWKFLATKLNTLKVVIPLIMFWFCHNSCITRVCFQLQGGQIKFHQKAALLVMICGSCGCSIISQLTKGTLKYVCYMHFWLYMIIVTYFENIWYQCSVFLTCKGISVAVWKPATSPVLPLQNQSAKKEYGGLKKKKQSYQSLKDANDTTEKPDIKWSFLEISLPSWVSLEDILKAILSDPRELLLRQTREGMSWPR